MRNFSILVNKNSWLYKDKKKRFNIQIKIVLLFFLKNFILAQDLRLYYCIFKKKYKTR